MSEAAYFHLSKTAIARGQGRSAIAAAAYRTGTCITNEREGTVADYTRKRGIVASWTIAPEGAPAWATDTAQLWNEVERKENRKNSQLAHELTLALPASLDDAGRQAIMEKFTEELQARYGCAVTVAIHRPSAAGDDRNDHAHVMLTTRRLGPEGWGDKIRELNSLPQVSEELAYIRERAATTINEALEDAGLDETVSHLSFKARGIKKTPTTHMGPDVTAMERAGYETERGDLNRTIIEERLRWQMHQVDPELDAATERELAVRWGDSLPARQQQAEPEPHLTPEPSAELTLRPEPQATDDDLQPEPEFAGEPEEPHRSSPWGRAWRAFSDAARAAAAQFAEYLRDEASGTPEDERGPWQRLIGAGRKAISGLLHDDAAAAREAWEEAVKIAREEALRRLHEAHAAEGPDTHHPPDEQHRDEPRHGAQVDAPEPDAAPQEAASPAGEEALDPFAHMAEWLADYGVEDASEEPQDTPEPEEPEPDRMDIEP